MIEVVPGVVVGAPREAHGARQFPNQGALRIALAPMLRANTAKGLRGMEPQLAGGVAGGVAVSVGDEEANGAFVSPEISMG